MVAPQRSSKLIRPKIKIWHSSTYRLEQSLNYGLERAWCVGKSMSHVESRDIHTNNEPGYQKNKQGIAVGFDEGAVVVTMGREEPVRKFI